MKVSIQPEIQALSLPADTELQLLRIVQEALSNIRKHANASRIWLSLWVKDNTLQLEIRDDGQGFDPSAKFADNRSDHYGLGTMRERAEAIGASFELESQIGVKTIILVQLRLNER